jgi:4-hydroxybenzoate polyprenyltransferase
MNDTNIKSDINLYGWLARLPESWKPYAVLMRLDRPIGWWLLLLPAWWGIVLGANGAQGMVLSDIRLMVLFLIGAMIMRGAGCVINDLWDRDLDKQVERTKSRPLASGQIPIYKAAIFLGYLLFCGFIILLMTSGVTIALGFLSMLFVATYPLMKRITWWPQAFLGVTFNFGALMGWSAATHKLELEAILLYVAAFFWTLGYDTIYAHQDKADDEMVGIKSTALLFGRRSKFWVRLFYVLMLCFLTAALIHANAGIVTFVLLIIPAIHLMRQVSDWDIDDPHNSLLVFQSNRNFGLLVLFAIAFVQIIPRLEEMTGYKLPEISIPHISSLTAALQ